MNNSNLCGKRNLGIGIDNSNLKFGIPETIDVGNFNSTNIDSLITQYQTNIVLLPSDDDPITKITKEYGSEPFYSSVLALNNYFLREDVLKLVSPNNFIPSTNLLTSSQDLSLLNNGIANDTSLNSGNVNDTNNVNNSGNVLVSADYPLLAQRLNTKIPFTPIEIAEFIIGYGYTPIGLSNTTTVISSKLILELESFYTDSFTSSAMGGFCALVPNVFGAINTFFSALDDVKNLVNKLKNFSLNFSLKSLIDNLKNQVLKVIDKVINSVKSAIDNFSLENILSQIKSTVNDKIGAQFQKIKETATKFFDKTNIDSFKKKIEALIDYATGIFKDPKLEEIQFLIFRFCSFIASIENGINALKTPLDNYANSYRQTQSILQASSSGNTVRAVRAGAIRYNNSMQENGIAESRAPFELAGNAPPLTSEDYKNITSWNDGKGDSRITFNGRWVSVLGRDGWEKVDPRVRALLMRVQKDFGKQIFINSGYRSPAYNAGLKGSAKNSYHMQGLACDCSWSGINSTNKEQFIRIARYHGFRGIGRYNSFIHVDVGPERTWAG